MGKHPFECQDVSGRLKEMMNIYENLQFLVVFCWCDYFRNYGPIVGKFLHCKFRYCYFLLALRGLLCGYSGWFSIAKLLVSRLRHPVRNSAASVTIVSFIVLFFLGYAVISKYFNGLLEVSAEIKMT